MNSSTNANLVLLVDDDALVVAVIEARLKREKYEVVSFTDPAHALDFFKRHVHDVAVLVSDIRMPHINGIQLAREVRAVSPSLPVILTTGFHVSSHADRQWITGNVQEVLQKPVRAGRLLEAIARAMTEVKVDEVTNG